MSALRSAWIRGWVFRVGFVYWMLYGGGMILAEPRLPVLDGPATALRWGTQQLAVWVGHHVLAISGPISTAPTASADRLVDWLSCLVWIAIAVIAGSVWAVIDRRRAHDARLRAVLRVTLRYALGLRMVGYGVDKLLALQFGAPVDSQLMQRLGDTSPMNFLWLFMGWSPAYQVFTGAAEFVGALLVLFRRTTTLGVLLLTTVLVNVVMLNLCYDVIVKLHSMHLLAICVLLLVPDAGRLVDLLVRQRAIPAPPPPPVIARRSWRIARRVVKYGTIGLVLLSLGIRMPSAYVSRKMPSLAGHWAAGSWHVTSFVRNGSELPIDDGARWEQLRVIAFDEELYVRWRFHADQSVGYVATFDDATHTLQLKADDGTVSLHYDRPDSTHLVLAGQVGADTLRVALTHDDTSHQVLRTRGFHWISEDQFVR
jgi:hypothetical protein